MTTRTAAVMRPATVDDEAFVRRTFAEASNPALAAAGLPATAVQALLDLQYRSRLVQWQAAHPGLTQYVLERDGVAVGVCSLAESGDGLRVVDLAVLPQHQRQGIARRTLRELAHRGEVLRLSVWADDPGARALYEEAGFQPDPAASTDNGYLELVLDPASTKGDTA